MTYTDEQRQEGEYEEINEKKNDDHAVNNLTLFLLLLGLFSSLIFYINLTEKKNDLE